MVSDASQRAFLQRWHISIRLMSFHNHDTLQGQKLTKLWTYSLILFYINISQMSFSAFPWSTINACLLDWIKLFNWIDSYKVNGQLIYALYWFEDIFILKHNKVILYKQSFKLYEIICKKKWTRVQSIVKDWSQVPTFTGEKMDWVWNCILSFFLRSIM